MAQMRGGINVEYTKSSGTDINDNNLFSVTAKGEGGVEVPFWRQGMVELREQVSGLMAQIALIAEVRHKTLKTFCLEI